MQYIHFWKDGNDWKIYKEAISGPKNGKVGMSNLHSIIEILPFNFKVMKVYDDKKLAFHYMRSRAFFLDIAALLPLDLLQLRLGSQPLLRFPRFLKVYRSVRFYYIVESRTVWPNLWRVVNLIHILLILAHWFGCFYYLLSEAEGFSL
uniref:Ion transport domain-containing protein n=1 Tax=Megaselia scalaris TaxID=36166 RepID=T1GXI5_MEGSC